MVVEEVPVASLSEDPANVRMHNARNIEAIKGSLRRFGQQKPIVVSVDDVVIAGNGTLRAVRELGWETIQIVRTGLSGPDAVGFAIADNRTAELAEWDADGLTSILKELAENDPELDLSDLGFEDADIEEYGPSSEQTEKPGTPPPSEVAGSLSESLRLIILFDSEEDQQAFLDKFQKPMDLNRIVYRWRELAEQEPGGA